MVPLPDRNGENDSMLSSTSLANVWCPLGLIITLIVAVSSEKVESNHGVSGVDIVLSCGDG
jgi:hypothetical protein